MIKEPKVFPMMKHTELINYVAKKIEAIAYLEIGVYNPEHNFNRVKVANKISVDPDTSAGAIYKCTSDEYFNTLNRIHFNDKPTMATVNEFDIIFIDGLHYSDQVRKDIENAWYCLKDGGAIIIHDTNPPTKQTTCVPRGSQREWCGDVYKTVCQIEIPEIVTLNDDYGVTIIRKQGELKFNDDIVTWEEFDLFRKDILNLKNWDEITQIIDSWQ